MTESDAPDGGGEGTRQTEGLVPPSNRLLDALERVLPDMPMMGVFMLLLWAYLIATGSNFGATDDVLDALQAASEAAAANGEPPF